MAIEIVSVSRLVLRAPLPGEREYDRLERECVAEGEEVDAVYVFVPENEAECAAQLGEMKAGLYARESSSEERSFRIASYLGYGAFCETLSAFALDVPAEVVCREPEAFAGRPFVELISLSDRYGSIGAPVAGKLAADFAAHREKARVFAGLLDDGDDFLDTYEDFREALSVAAEGGVLSFC